MAALQTAPRTCPDLYCCGWHSLLRHVFGTEAIARPSRDRAGWRATAEVLGIRMVMACPPLGGPGEKLQLQGPIDVAGASSDLDRERNTTHTGRIHGRGTARSRCMPLTAAPWPTAIRRLTTIPHLTGSRTGPHCRLPAMDSQGENKSHSDRCLSHRGRCGPALIALIPSLTSGGNGGSGPSPGALP